jgi:hypothetical protein
MRRTVILEGMELLARYLGHAPKEWMLTYVIELLSLPANTRNVGDVSAHVAETLAQVRPWVTMGEFDVLEREIDQLLLTK